MTKPFKLGVFLVLFFASNSIWAQHFVLGELNLSFEFSNRFEVVDHDDEADYEVICDGIEIDAYDVEEEEDEVDDLALWTVELAEEQLDIEHVGKIHLTDIDGRECAWIEGDRDGDELILLVLRDDETDEIAYFIVNYDDEDEDADDRAIRIIHTLRVR